MRPFSLQFKEIPSKEVLDYSLIEYDKQLNLSVNKLTGLPAVGILSMGTTTATRANKEESDSDYNSINRLMDTTTFTKADGEDSDSDEDEINLLIDTSTQTFTKTEASDSDK